MTPEQIDGVATVHFWISSSCFFVALLGLILLFVSFCMPVRSKFGNALFAWAVGLAVGATVFYLLYAASSVVVMVVMKS